MATMKFYKILYAIVLLTLVKIISTVSDDFNQQPQIQTDNGKLIMRAAPSRNITLSVKGEGSIFINSVNILNKIMKKSAQLRPPHRDKDTLTTQSVRSYLDALKTDLIALGVRFAALQNRTRGRAQSVNIRRSLLRLQRAHIRATQIEIGLMVDECKEEGRNATKCQNGGTCYDGYKNFHCECPSGWTGTTCEEDVDECYLYAGTDLGCQNNGDCINTLGSYSCSCRNGFYGTHCRIRKVACEEGGNEELCGHGTCVSANNDAGFACICDQGWTKNKVIPEAACSIDINECDESTNPCHSECINLPGSFKCSPCPDGYTGNGISCSDIDECAMNNGGCSMRPKVSCINTEGSYHCGNCPIGWEGDGRICESSAPESCASKNICYPGSKCEYISNTVVCTCPPGMYGHGFGTDGCTVQPITNPCTNHTCQNNATCEVIGGGTRCFCAAGFLGPTCDQPDACQSKPCLNGGSCTLLQNNQYRCSCPRGTTGRNCEIVRDVCGSIIRMRTGSLSYPPGGGNYLPNERCAWIIRTDNALILNVTVSTFDLEAAADCNKDWLQLHDGRSLASRLIGRFCGKSLPLGGNILTTQNSMFFWFRSDNETTGAGFNLTWNSIEYICGDVFNLKDNANGLIRSPGYPGKAPPGRDCEWKLNAPFGYRFILRFFEINLGSTRDNNCTRDTVMIYDSDLLLRSVCEPSLIEPLHSSSNLLQLQFHTDTYGTDSSFQLHYEVVPSAPNCGGVFTEATGIITGYINGRVCSYLIQQPIGTKIQLEFTNVDLLRSEGCYVQKIQVFDGATDESNLLKVLCGKQEETDPITSSDNVILLRYEYLLPSFSLPKNFEVKYTRICNSEIQGFDAGFLTTPNYPNSYYEHMECTFIIRGPANSVVHANFTDFSISKNGPQGDSSEAAIESALNGTAIDVDETYVDVYLAKNVKRRYYEGAFLHLISERNLLSIVFHGGSNKQKGRGIRVDYHFEIIKCGGVFTEESGFFPLHSATGETAENCEWVIEAPKGKHIQMRLQIYYLSIPPPCSPGEMDIAIYSNDTFSDGQLLMSSCGKAKDIRESFHANIITIFLRMRRKDNIPINFGLGYNIVDNKAACGGTFTAQYGTIKTPSWPQNYGDSLNCTWIIEAPLGHKIEIVARNFSVETTSKNCNDDYLEIRNGKSATSPLIGKYCGNTIPTRIPSFANYLYLNFISDSYLTDKGFYLTWQQTETGCGGKLTSYTGSIHSPHNSDIYGGSISCDWQITVSRGSTITIYITLTGNNLNICDQDILTVNDGSTVSNPQLKFNCGYNSTTVQLKTSTNQAVIIYNFKKTNANAGLQFVIDYETNCVVKLDNLLGVIESPNFPDNYPPNLNCFWDIHGGQNNKFQLIFSHFESEIRNDECSFDYIEIFDLRNDDVLSKQHLCSNPLKAITTEGNRFQVKFVTDYSDHAKGFRLEYKRIGCGSVLTGNYGSIQSPNAPYSVGLNCDWQIEVEAGKRIVLSFDEIHIESESGDCSEDGIVVSDEKNSTSYLLKECRIDQVPVTVTSSANHLNIHFYTSNTRARKYISGAYRARPASCGGTFRGNSGHIRYPVYAAGTDVNTECVWLITVDNSYGINLVFDSFNISCTDTFLSIWDVGVKETKLVQKTCGSALPESRWVQSNRLRVIYKASGASWGTFSFKFKKACGGYLNDTFGYIKSRWDEHCEWRIETEGSKIFLDIHHLECDCSKQANCTNGLRLINGNDKSELNSFCDNHQSNIILPTNALHIVATKIEFKALYSIVQTTCGGTLTSMRGILTSPYYPQSYPSNVECVWEIKASPGNYLELSINELDIVKSENCNEDFLEIRQTSALGKILQVFCSNEVVTDRIVVFERAWLKFRSVEGNTANGFKLQWNYVHANELNSTTGSIESPPLNSIRNQEPFTWRITLPRGDFIFIEFKVYNRGLRLYDGFDDLALEIPIPVSPWQFTSSSNVLYLVSNNDELDAFKVVWKTVNSSVTPTNSSNGDCNKTFIINNAQRLNISSPGYPNGYANDLDCEWIIKSEDPMEHVVLRIYEVKLETFGEDYLRIFTSTNLRDWHKELDMYDTRDMSLEPVKIVHGTPYIKLLLHTDSSINGSGFTSLAKTTCGTNMTDLTGQIVAKNVMRSWSSNSLCIWHIEVQMGKRIAIDFNFGKNIIPKTQECRQYAIIYDGFDDNAPILSPGRICNQMGLNVKNMESSTNRLTIKYNLNWTTPFEKDLDFNLTYHQIGDCDTEIQLTHYLNAVNISSPNYPNVPNPHTECSWIIMGPVGETLQAEFIETFSFNTRYCNQEFIEFFDGSTELSRSLGRFCTKPNAIRSTGNILRVHYLTDINEPRNGFHLNISIATCGGTYVNINGEITSSGYPTPGAYPKPSACEYTIKMPRTSRISLNFTDFDLHFEYTNLNRSDRIEITTLDENPETIAVLYGNTTTKPVLEVDYNAVRLRFVTFTTTQRHRGFKLRYNRLYGSCYRDVEDTSGVIKLNMQPRSAIFISCRWKIKVPKGQRVTLEFDKFEAESVNNNTERFISSVQRYPNFLTTKMSFFNDPDMLSKITEIMNDFSLPDKILSSDNFMYIRIDIYQRITTFRKIQVRYSSDEESACPPDINEQVFGSINTNNLPPNVNFFCNSKFGLSGFETITFKIKELLVYGSNTNRFAYAIRFKDERSLMALKTINTNATDTTVSISSQGGTLSILQTDLLKIRRFSVDFYRHACGGSFHVLDVPKIVFPTENFVHNGDESPIECSWTITNTGARSPLKLVGNLSLDNDCSKEYISIRSRLSPDYTETIKLCHNSTELTTGIPLKQSIVTILYSTNKYRSSSTFQIAVETTVACGMRTRVVTNMNTPVVSVNSKTYKNNMECSWEFETITGLYMTVEFTGRFFIEKSVNCSKDYLQIYAYEDEVWQPKERYCGRDVPNSYNGTSNRLLIVFRTDNATRGDGFTFRISPSCTATFNVTDQLQMVQPPTDEIGTYSRLRCSYTFLTSSDNAINVQIISNTLFARRRYYLNQPCPYGMFTAYKKDDDGNEIQSGEYCRSVEVNAKHYLRISSDVSFDTFLITYQLDTCGGNITSYANIRPLMADNSDGGDYQYANNMNCVWNVMAPPDYSIVVRFKYFDMEEHDQCIFDFVAIYAGSSTRPDNELAKFCGNLTANPPLVLVDDQQAVITAVSDINNAHKGFFAEVIFVRNCNERIALTNDDTIAQPLVMIRNYTVNTYDELHCQIRVTAPESYRVKVQVRKLDIISGKCTNSKCEDCNYLEVIQGAQKSDTLSMGKFCANDDDGRRKLVTSDEHALLQFSFTKAGNYSVELVLEIEKSLCGKLNEIQLTGDQAVNIQFPPNNNSEYLPNVHCKWRIKSERDYQIHFEYLLLQPTAPETGKCNDFLRLTQQEITEYYCGNATGFTKYISSQEDDGSSYTELTFHSDDSVEDKGFNITISYQQPCNLTYTRLSGLMDFKAKDNANQTCLADIMVPDEYVLNFNIRATNSYYSGANCSSPNLQINESITNKNLLQQCISYYYDENLNTNASAIHIFTTSLDSFHMFYYATKRSAGIGCGGEIQTMDGVIRSPSYDDRNFSECRWDITVPEPSHVQVNFITFDMGSKVNCEFDYVNIVEVSSIGEEKVAKNICADQYVYNFVSKTSKVAIVSKKSPNFNGNGWTLSFQAVSKYVLT